MADEPPVPGPPVNTANVRTIWEVRAAAGEPSAVVRVRNLQTTIEGPSDAWKRASRPQPVSISASVMLNRSFGSSSATDKVASDTVHYGLLSKQILKTVTEFNKNGPFSRTPNSQSLHNLSHIIWMELTGRNISGHRTLTSQEPFLNISGLRCLEFTVHLPKASLLGSGVSLVRNGVFQHENGESTVAMVGMCLKIHELRVPTLIGVNDNERTAKQVVVASVEIERLVGGEDIYVDLEAEVVKAMSESSFETLEALAHTLGVEIGTYLHSNNAKAQDETGWVIRVILEKPIAVPFADASCVELTMNSAEVLNDVTKIY